MAYGPKHTTGEGCQVWVTKPAQRPIKNGHKKAQRPNANIKTQFMHHAKSLNPGGKGGTHGNKLQAVQFCRKTNLATLLLEPIR